ncbi:hypothetical protein AnigIFM50267_006998 [Aspergillus niger]|nr:hypothetical protein AnigIFM50267_006998 [Aspergillus niger]
MGDDTGNGRNAFFQGHWSGFPPQPRQGNYLVPGLHPYAPSSYAPSSPYSPVSTSRSMSPIDGLHLDTSFLTDGSMNDLAGMQMTDNGIQGLPVGEDDVLSLAVPTMCQAQGGIHVDDLNPILSKLAAAVQAKLPQQDAAHLYELKDLLSASYNTLIGMVQRQIDTTGYQPHSPGSSDSPGSTHNGDRYICYLCPKENHNILFADRGTFRRHVSYKHHPEFRYLCLAHPICDWGTNRRDKIYPHMRTHRIYQVSQAQVNRFAIRQRPPRNCGLCWKPVSCWAEYFKCVANHCRIKNVDSTNSSASLSRWGSDDRGGGGNNGTGFGGNYPPGNGFGPSGPQQFYPGNNGSFSSSDAGQNNGHYGHNFSGYTGTTNRDDEDSTSSYSCGEADTVADVAPSPSCCSSDIPHAMDVPAPSSIISQHLALMQMTEETESCGSVSHKEDYPPSTSGESDLRDLGDETYRRISRPPNDAASDRKRTPRLRTEDLFKKRCQGCGHVLVECDKCCRLKETIFQCHFCADNTCKLPASMRDPQESEESERCKRTINKGDIGIPGRPLWTDHWSLSPTEHSLEPLSLFDHDHYMEPAKGANMEAGKSSNDHILGLKAANDGCVHFGSSCPLSLDSPVDSEVTCSSMNLDTSYCQALPSLDAKGPQEAFEAVHKYGRGNLFKTEEFIQTLDMLSATESTYQSYEILSFCVLNAVQDFFDQMLVSWLVCEAALLHTVSLSYRFGERSISEKRTESAISRRYLPHPWEKMRYQPTARQISRRKHSQLRTKLQVISGILILRATVLRRKPMMISSTETSAEVSEPSKIGTELQVVEPGVQVSPTLEVMFSRGTEVVADAVSSLITGVMSATEEEMEYIKPISVHISNLFTKRSTWLGEESLIE